jgi:hypothetical protein
MKLSVVEYQHFLFKCQRKLSLYIRRRGSFFNAGHVVLCVKIGQSDLNLEIYSLCLQNSALTNNALEIQRVLSINNDILKISSI